MYKCIYIFICGLSAYSDLTRATVEGVPRFSLRTAFTPLERVALNLTQNWTNNFFRYRRVAKSIMAMQRDYQKLVRKTPKTGQKFGGDSAEWLSLVG